jgi:hypothetical protein
LKKKKEREGEKRKGGGRREMWVKRILVFVSL